MPLPARRLLMVGRNNRKKSNHPIDLMIKHLSADGYLVEWFKPKFQQGIEARIHWQTQFKSTWLGALLCRWRPLKGLLMEWVKWGYWISHPLYLFRLLSTHNNNRAIANELSQVLKETTDNSPIILMCYSAGGIQGALASLSGGISHLISFGYPFQHPDKPPEAARTQHLAALKTPMLILQGDRDPYGCHDVSTRYPLSPSITLEVVDADHEYLLSDTEASRIYHLIQQFLATTEKSKDHPAIPASQT